MPQDRTKKPQYAHSARLLVAWIKREGITQKEFSTRLTGKEESSGLTSPWFRGAGAPGARWRSKVAALIGAPVEELVPGWSASAQPKVGPARQALLEHDHKKVTSLEPVPTIRTPPVTEVFSFRARSDGTVAVMLNTVLPFTKAVALAQTLMNAGVMMMPTEDKGE